MADAHAALEGIDSLLVEDVRHQAVVFALLEAGAVEGDHARAVLTAVLEHEQAFVELGGDLAFVAKYADDAAHARHVPVELLGEVKSLGEVRRVRCERCLSGVTRTVPSAARGKTNNRFFNDALAQALYVGAARDTATCREGFGDTARRTCGNDRWWASPPRRGIEARARRRSSSPPRRGHLRCGPPAGWRSEPPRGDLRGRRRPARPLLWSGARRRYRLKGGPRTIP